MISLPTLPPGGLTAAQRARFVNEACGVHWDAMQSNGKEALERHYQAEYLRRAFFDLWDAYNNEIAPVENKGIQWVSVKPLPWLSYEQFTPSLVFYSDDSPEQLIKRVENYDTLIGETAFLWDWTRGVVGVVESGDTPARYALIHSIFSPEYAAEMGRLSEEQLGEFFQTQAEMKIRFLTPYALRIDGKPLRGNAVLEVGLKLLRFTETQEYRLSTAVSLTFAGPAPILKGFQGRTEIPIELWNLIEADIEKYTGQCKLSVSVDWAACLNAAILAEPADPNQMEMPLEVPNKISITQVIDLATFPFPTDNNSRLLHQAFGVTPSKEWKRLSRIYATPKADRTPQDIEAAEAIKGRIVMNRKPEYDDKYRPMGVTLGLKIRDTKTIAANAVTTIFPENTGGGEVTLEHLQDAEDTFFRHFAQLFTGQGRRHVALLIKELYQSNWKAYQFEAGAHVAKMRNIKAGESPTKAEKEDAKRMIAYLCNSLFDIQSREGKRLTADRQRYFNLERVQETSDRKGEIWTISATDQLKNLFLNVPKNELYYVPVLESIIREDHQAHGVAVMLNLHLSQLWRMDKKDPIQKLSIQKIFDLIGKDPSPKNENRMRDLKNLEKELDYMTAQDPPYLGTWEGNGDAPRPSKCRTVDPFDCVLTLTAPDWLRPILKQIQDRHGAYLPKPSEKVQGMTREGLEAVIQASGLSANKFAAAIGFSKGILSETRSGKREITPALEAKIRTRFPDLTAV